MSFNLIQSIFILFFGSKLHLNPQIPRSNIALQYLFTISRKHIHYFIQETHMEDHYIKKLNLLLEASWEKISIRVLCSSQKELIYQLMVLTSKFLVISEIHLLSLEMKDAIKASLNLSMSAS
jgi:hypothetical protein